MHKFQTRRRVPFSAEQMFQVVAAVDRYPEFLPLCESIDVRSRERRGVATELVATMSIGYQALAESFTSRVMLHPDKREILVTYLDGPFSHLENRWVFRDLSGGSEVDFFIAYEFRSTMLALLMGALFDKAVRKFASAFEERAYQLYRNPRMPTQVANSSK